MAAEDCSPGEMRPLRDYYQYQLSPSPLSSPLPDESPDLENNVHLTRSISVNTALSSSASAILGGSASFVDGIMGNGESPSATLTFQDLRVEVELGGVLRTVLDGVTGFAEPGKLLGIMGPPRSGKSTLLDTLAGKLNRNALYEGEILLNGRRQQLTYGTAANVSRGDVLTGTLTVQETVQLSALLRLPECIPYGDKILVAERAVQDMGLRECAAVRVGSSLYQSGLTDGERRRLTIAMELITRPRLLYLDDPIAGLDSASALCLIARLKCLAMDGGQTVIATFQQVNADSFELVDNLCLLVKPGRMVYFGESSCAAEHFTRSGCPCPPGYNLPEHFLRSLDPAYDQVRAVSSAAFSSLQDPEKKEVHLLLRDQTAQVVRALASAYVHSPLANRMATRRKELAKKKGAVLVSNGRHASFERQVVALAYRSILNCTRDLSYFWCMLGVSVVLMLIVGTLFLSLGSIGRDNSGISSQARFSCLFVVLESMMLVVVVGGCPFHFRELRVFSRERENPHYGPAALVVGSSLASVPFMLVMSAVAACVVYFIPGLHTGFEQFAYFALALAASLITVDGLVLAISVLAHSPYATVAVALPIQVLSMLVAGYFRRLEDLPEPIWRYPMSCISFHTYALRGLLVNEFHGSKFPGSLLQTEDNIIRSHYGKDHQSKWRDLLVLLGMAIIFRILVYFLMVACNSLHPYVRVLVIQHKNKTSTNRNTAEQKRRAGKFVSPPHRGTISSTVSGELELRVDRSQDDIEFVRHRSKEDIEFIGRRSKEDIELVVLQL